MEINLNKQNRFAEHKTRTPQLLQPACFHRALPVSLYSTVLGEQHPASGMYQVSVQRPGGDGAEWEKNREVGLQGLGLGVRWN